MKKIETLLREHPFIKDLEEEVIALISGCARNAVFQSDEYLFKQGGPADRFFLIRHGTVALEIFRPGRGAFTFLTVKSGEFLGSTWLLPPYQWVYDARAVEVTRAIAFDARCMREKCEADHHVGYEMMKRFLPPLIDRLNMSRLQSADLYGDDGR